MAKKSPKRNDADVKKLTAKAEKLRARLEKADARAAKWKAEAKRIEAEAVETAKQLEELRKVQAQSIDAPVSPTVAEVKAPTTSGVPDESWTATRLRESARDAGVPGYSRMTKTALLDSLTQPK